MLSTWYFVYKYVIHLMYLVPTIFCLIYVYVLYATDGLFILLVQRLYLHIIGWQANVWVGWVQSGCSGKSTFTSQWVWFNITFVSCYVILIVLFISIFSFILNSSDCGMFVVSLMQTLHITDYKLVVFSKSIFFIA